MANDIDHHAIVSLCCPIIVPNAFVLDTFVANDIVFCIISL